MDSKQSKPMCWEITGCGNQDGCKILKLVRSTGKPCWDVVVAFTDYRSALNVCSDCIVTVISQQHSLSLSQINDLKRSNSNSSSHNSCPGLVTS